MILNVLREATTSVHARVEQLIPVMDPELDRGRYLRILKHFYSLYVPLEARVQQAVDHSQFAGEAFARGKVQWLVEDFRALGLTAEEIASIPAVEVPAMTTFSEGVGAMYVMEGATLGGQHIVKRLVRDFPELPRRFFMGYGEETGRKWNRFREMLLAEPRVDRAAAVQGALATFDCFEETFGRAAVGAVESEI